MESDSQLRIRGPVTNRRARGLLHNFIINAAGMCAHASTHSTNGVGSKRQAWIAVACYVYEWKVLIRRVRREENESTDTRLYASPINLPANCKLRRLI